MRKKTYARSARSRARGARRPPPLVAAIVALLLVLLAGPGRTYLARLTGTGAVSGQLELSAIPVGKADSLLVTVDGHAMLVDAGNDGDGAMVLNYLREAGVSRLDAVICTHPHEDHIGGMDEVLSQMPASRVYLSPREHTTEHYGKLIAQIYTMNIPSTIPKPGDSFALGGATVTFLAPLREDYEEINDSSLVARVDYGSTSFLLMGDAEAASERDLRESGQNLRADVLKLGHHGSNTSSGKKFLDMVKPKIAVITCDESVGKGPDGKVLDNLAALGAQVLRTDRVGAVRVLSDGAKVWVRNTGQ